jgi:hypothetical protein
VGRGLGVLAGLIVGTWLTHAALLSVGALTLILMACFYIYFSGRLSYTFLNAGLYAVVLFDISRTTPALAPAEGMAMFMAIVLGVAAADVVNWLAGAEATLAIDVGHAPLWPLRRDWLNQSLMLAVTVLLASQTARLLGLPVLDSAISVMMLTITPDIQSLIQKGELRIAGALLAGLYSLFMFLVIMLSPHFTLLATLLFLGLLLASYLTHEGGTYSYAGLQMGLVLPMIVLAEPGQFGSLQAAVQRLQGIAIALVISLLVGGIWPFYPMHAAPSTTGG